MLLCQRMPLARELSLRTLDELVGRFELKELGDPHTPLYGVGGSGGTRVGALRLFAGDEVRRLVYIELRSPGLDSHMIFAFTPRGSALPHFTLDAVETRPAGPEPSRLRPEFAFHLDLVPRVDLGVNLGYLDAIYEPLTPTFNAVREIEGLSLAHVAPRQRALMSPWMLAHRADEGALRALGAPVAVYLEHWARLLVDGLPHEVAAHLHCDDLADRDRRNRAAIFDPDVDPVWSVVGRLVGGEVCEAMRAVLCDAEGA
jgi:hypothetical protein